MLAFERDFVFFSVTYPEYVWHFHWSLELVAWTRDLQPTLMHSETQAEISGPTIECEIRAFVLSFAGAVSATTSNPATVLHASAVKSCGSSRIGTLLHLPHANGHFSEISGTCSQVSCTSKSPRLAHHVSSTHAASYENGGISECICCWIYITYIIQKYEWLYRRKKDLCVYSIALTLASRSGCHQKNSMVYSPLKEKVEYSKHSFLCLWGFSIFNRCVSFILMSQER